MNILEYMQNRTVFLDGAMGTLLQQKGLVAELVSADRTEGERFSLSLLQPRSGKNHSEENIQPYTCQQNDVSNAQSS